MGRTMEMVDGKVLGCEVSAYGKEKGYLDYRTLANILIRDLRYPTKDTIYLLEIIKIFKNTDKI